MTTPIIFISYSHKDEEWKDRLVSHLGVLQQQGLFDLWDDRRIDAGVDWHAEIERAINTASVAVMLVTANFLTSKFILDEEVPRLLERREKEGARIFPVVVKPCAWMQVKWLARMQARPKDGRPLSAGNDYQIDSDLATIAEEMAAIIRRAGHIPSPRVFVQLGPDKVSTAKLPSTYPDLFGRDKELAALDAAWENPHINVLSLVAWGGGGKTALVNKWLSKIAQDNYRGAERVYGWSFYSQGAAERRQVSADPFIAAALAWFGDPDPTRGSPWDKGERLADLVKSQRTLVIVDGLEPLQNPPPVDVGKIKDPALCSLLRELAQQNPGLVIITTRLTMDDLKDFVGGSAIEIDLENLSTDAGVAYLAHLGVKGTTEELARAADEFGGHALALTLLGKYLATVHRGDVRQCDKITRLTDEQRQGAHARRVMESYERWFEGKPELYILRLMGLFDRPAESGALDALKKKPPIQHLTSNLQHLSQADWRYAVENLRAARLLSAPDPNEPDTLDCHPLLGEHFGDKLRADNPKAWREAHSRLYEYYKSHAKEYPDTIEEMAPLYAAVVHGCQARRYHEALFKVYHERICRTGQQSLGASFSLAQLGAYSADLAALSGFFDLPWTKPITGLKDSAYVLAVTGFILRGLGRLAEAKQAMQAALETYIADKNRESASIQAGNLSEVHLSTGDIPRALAYAQQSVSLADHSPKMRRQIIRRTILAAVLKYDIFFRMISRTILANVLHHAGRLLEAEVTFRDAEEMEKEVNPKHSVLYTVRGFWYCDLLLTLGKYQEVQNRAARVLEWSPHLLDIALVYLSLGCAHLSQAQLGSAGDYSQAATYLERAVDALRQVGEQIYIVRGLLARAELLRVTGALDKARRDLDEAFSIATRNGMRLYESDCHLEYTRLYLALGQKDTARGYWVKAKQMIEEIGYHRRDEAVKELEAQL